jgi:hypothetical protein
MQASTFFGHHCNYEIHDKGMLAIIRALEDWHHFLEGACHKFEIWTDHKNLEYFMTVKKLRADHGAGGGGKTTIMSYSVWNSLQLMQYITSLDYHSKEMNGTSRMQTVQASRRMLWQRLQENSRNPRESLCGHQNGQNTMNCFVSGTVSMCPMIWSDIVASPLSTMTPSLQDTLGIGKP